VRSIAKPCVAAALGAALGVALGGCSGGEKAATASPRPSVVRIEVPLGPGDVAQHAPPRRNGHTQLQPILARCGIVGITGTHAEFIPERPLCRVRVRVLNDDASFHTVSPRAQRLVLADGGLVEESLDAIRAKRQPDAIDSARTTPRSSTCGSSRRTGRACARSGSSATRTLTRQVRRSTRRPGHGQGLTSPSPASDPSS